MVEMPIRNKAPLVQQIQAAVAVAPTQLAEQFLVPLADLG
jgi:hypothetical protein